jgi:multimeric flavodoxin WrbA
VKRLLVVFHSQTGHTARMAGLVAAGAAALAPGVETRVLRCADAAAADLLACDGVVFGTPENFGYMSGALKDFLDRVYYPLQGRIQGRPYAVFISAGSDGTGALTALRRILRGFPLREVREPVIIRGEADAGQLRQCEELGLAMAAGLDAGIL